MSFFATEDILVISTLGAILGFVLGVTTGVPVFAHLLMTTAGALVFPAVLYVYAIFTWDGR